MATSDTPKTSPASSDAEPFGQAGVRQHVGVVVDALCIMVVVIAGVLWFRSLGYVDALEWRGGTQEVFVRSVAGRLRIEAAVYNGRVNNNAGWLYRRRPIRTIRDEWAPSILKTVGLEFSSGPTSSSAVGGFWIRVKWYFIVIVFSIVPLLRALLKWRRSREERT